MKETFLREASGQTPDPERAFNNLVSFLEENPEQEAQLEASIRAVSLLFSDSQFLANYAVRHPDLLFQTLKEIDSPLDSEKLQEGLQRERKDSGGSASSSKEGLMTALREFRMKQILRITLRDILNKADLVETMLDLSAVADVVIDGALTEVRREMSEIYGEPADDAFCVIALGKLGGEELNFSSDIDLMFVYGTEVGETRGVRTSHGVSANRITNHEYYCKVGEALTRVLALRTESGLAYRVDLRLRPEGQRGDIALALRGYEMYYESWGRAWERAMLIRARPCAGNISLGDDFISAVRPFVYRKYLDFTAIDEIKRLKTRIDSTFKRGDIKRGYGGIREIEFFVQALQLIYGGKEPLLRERSTLKVLHRLLQKRLVGDEDYAVLSENYRYLRTLEHRLQQVNDLQTHVLPTGRTELAALGRKMGFADDETFMGDLDRRRVAVRDIYDSLFAGKTAEASSGGPLFDEELTDAELREYLSQTGIRDLDRAIRNIKSIKDSTFTFQTLRGRRLLSEILPAFLDIALKSDAPDIVLNRLQSFATFLGTNESYLEVFSKNRELMETLSYAFSQSEYLSKMLMGRPQYLEMIGWQGIFKKTLAALVKEAEAGPAGGYPIQDSVRILRQTEEIRLGLLFLQKKISVIDVVKGLSKTAEAVLSASLRHLSEEGGRLAVIGLGKLGGREITFNSDLDLIFVTPGDVTMSDTRTAERLLRLLIAYTGEGVAYRVDTRLRPEGSKGPLVSAVEGLNKYYAEDAAFWEFQALLKARPVTGCADTGRTFLRMARDVLLGAGQRIAAADIGKMRERIVRELSRDASGYDIKLGRGGIEEIEFTVQYLQLAYCSLHEDLLVQNTVAAMRRLARAGILDDRDASCLRDDYLFYRRLEAFLRLRGGPVLRREDAEMRSAAGFMGIDGGEELAMQIERCRGEVRRIHELYLSH